MQKRADGQRTQLAHPQAVLEQQAEHKCITPALWGVAGLIFEGSGVRKGQRDCPRFLRATPGG